MHSPRDLNATCSNLYYHDSISMYNICMHAQVDIGHIQASMLASDPKHLLTSSHADIARSCTTPQNAHNPRKWSQLQKMLTTPQNTHNSTKCSQFQKMVTTPENAHSSTKCSQFQKMLTTP